MNVGKVKGQTFVFGAIILLISNILVKIIGAFFRLPITNIIGVEGMAYFNSAYAIYVVFYNISTAGIPVAVARMVASSNERQNQRRRFLQSVFCDDAYNGYAKPDCFRR